MGYGVAFSNIIAFALVVMSLMTIEDWDAKFEFKLILVLVVEALLVVMTDFKISLTVALTICIVYNIRRFICAT